MLRMEAAGTVKFLSERRFYLFRTGPRENFAVLEEEKTEWFAYQNRRLSTNLDMRHSLTDPAVLGGKALKQIPVNHVDRDRENAIPRYRLLLEQHWGKH